MLDITRGASDKEMRPVLSDTAVSPDAETGVNYKDYVTRGAVHEPCDQKTDVSSVCGEKTRTVPIGKRKKDKTTTERHKCLISAEEVPFMGGLRKQNAESGGMFAVYRRCSTREHPSLTSL